MVEGVLKSESPREELARKVFSMLQRYDRPPVPPEQWDELKARLRAIGTEGIDGFVRALDSPHSPTRGFAVNMLRDTGQSDDVVEDLLKQALQDGSRKVRRMAFCALHDIMAHGDDEKRRKLMPAVLPLLWDRSKRLRKSAWYFTDEDFQGFAQHVPVETAARALLDETDPDVRDLKRRLLDAVLRAHGEADH